MKATSLTLTALLLACLAGCDTNPFGTLEAEFIPKSAAAPEPKPTPEAPVDKDGDGVVETIDCNDADKDVGAASAWLSDIDGDGWGTGNTIASCVQLVDTVAFDKNGDCDDEDDSRFSGAPELCDNKDNDCDGVIDDSKSNVWYHDADGDGWGDPAKPFTDGCNGSSFLSANASDCDDVHAFAHPGGTEECDGLDNDCNGKVDEDVKTVWWIDFDGDGFGDSAANVTLACVLPEGHADNPSDCNDKDADVHPGATEVCDGVDNDCSGSADGDASDRILIYFDEDGDGHGFDKVGATSSHCPDQPLPPGYVLNKDDCDDQDGSVHPLGEESCNGQDDDCDAEVDEAEPNENLCNDDDPFTTDHCDALADTCVHEMTMIWLTCELPEAYDEGYVCGAAAFLEYESGEYSAVSFEDEVLGLNASAICAILSAGGLLHINSYVYLPEDPFLTWVGGEQVSVEDPQGAEVSGSPGTVTVFPSGLDFIYELSDFAFCQQFLL
jgi:hypothetical protein